MPQSSSHAEQPVLSIEDLEVVFDTLDGPVTAITGVNLELPRGKTVAVVGESGSGKSVTAYAILRIIQKPGRITRGRILFSPRNGEPCDIAALSEKDDRLYQLRGGKIGMIFQEPMTALSPVHTIGNQIVEAIRLHRPVTRQEAEKEAAAMLGRVGIKQPEERLKQYPHEFSGGMRQRVVIAMALVCKPEILIADEPTTALDVTIQAQILDLINELKNELGAAVLFITHDLGVVAQMADEVVVMNRSRVMERAPVLELFDQPFHPYTRGLLASMPRLDQPQSRLARVEVSHDDIAGLPTGYSLRREDARPGAEPCLLPLEGRRQILVWPTLN